MPTENKRRKLDEWLRDHHQVVTAARLTVLGFSRDYARVQVQSLRWQRVHRGVYCAYTGPLSFDSRCAAALAACDESAVLAARTALQIHGMTGVSSDDIDILVGHGSAVRALSGVHVTSSTTLSERSTVERRQMPVVKIDRAVIGAALLRPKLARAILTASVQQGMTTAVRLRACIFAMGRIHGRRQLLAITHNIEGGDRSVLERRFIALVIAGRLPRPRQNHPLVIDGRRLWIDVCYPELRIAVEIDGKAYHLFAEDWADDLDRQNALVLDGWLVLRFTARAIRRDPERVLAQVRSAIAQQSALMARFAG